MNLQIIFVLFITNFFFLTLPAQEVLLPLQSNPQKSIQKADIRTNGPGEEIVLELPFFEDFSYTGPYPDHQLWADSFVYVNQYFHVHPVSIGVATFDALDQYGFIYEIDNIYQFEADHLTTHKIRLDSVFEPSPKALAPEDSVYISFYYQPQGKGLAPIDRDSLVLEFLHTPEHYYIDNNDNGDDNEFIKDHANDNGNNGDTVWVDDKWVSVWSTEGETLSEFTNDTFPYFKKVMIAITDTVYFRDDFRFRFKNYSSFPYERTPTNYAGNRSIWNVDYITLDHGRSVADTFYYDLTFAKPAESLLKPYTAMPWSHYIADPDSHLKNNLDVAIKNLNNIEHQCLYNYRIIDLDKKDTTTYSGGWRGIAPFHEAGYQDWEPHSNPKVLPNPLPTAPAEKKHFKILHTIREADGDDNPRNDTIYYNQVFDNYFAYDNGVSNAGYILEGFEPQSAKRFFLGHTDTLHGIKIFFNHTLENQNQSPFHLMVWSSLSPENVVYESEVFMPEYADELNRFYTYSFGDDYVVLEDTFYIGWRQTTNEVLNVGYDLSSRPGNNLFYNTDGQWRPSMYEGALMIRPVIGRKPDTHVSPVKEPLAVKLYPNPVRGNYLHVKIRCNQNPDTGDIYFQIYDITGRLIMNDQLQQTIPVKSLSNGIYIVRIFDKHLSKSVSEKIIISR